MNERLFDKADFLKRLFDAVPSLLFAVDRDVRIHHLNAAAMKLLSVDGEAALLKRGGDAMHCIHSFETPEGCGHATHCGQCVIRNSVTKAFQGENIHRETTKMELLRDGGTREVHFMVTASPLRYDGRDFVLLIMEDITNLKKTEEELQRQAAQLEAANRELQAFGYSVSHDLKAPIRSINGFSDILLQDFALRLDAEGKDCITRIRSASMRMGQLIDDMLALSRVTQNEMRREDVDLSATARAIADEVMTSRDGRSIEFVIAPRVRANGDSRLLRVVLENLIGNAVKFTSAHPVARIEFGVLTEGSGPVYFVKDDGAGFDMTYAGNLFAPFRRLHASSQFPGTGIGLATVRRIIHRHNGRIWAESAVEKGTAFYFTLKGPSLESSR